LKKNPFAATKLAFPKLTSSKRLSAQKKKDPLRKYKFHFDTFSNQKITGWIFNKDNPNTTVDLQIYDSKKLLFRTKANTFRNDLLKAGIGNGYHVFDIKVPKSIKFLADDNSAFLNQKDVHHFSSSLYINGEGIKIGALHNPLWVKSNVKVKYVDIKETTILKKTYPELKGKKLTKVDIVDDGEKLNTIKNNSLDFIICNHMLEHCQNPLGTIRNHLKKIKKGGYLYYTVPNKNHTFNIKRKLTTFDHLKKDDLEESKHSQKEHLTDWIKFVEKLKNKKKIIEILKYLVKINYNIHYHVWDEHTFLKFTTSLQSYLNQAIKIVHFIENDKELVAILKK